jgi:hypothetical protein
MDLIARVISSLLGTFLLSCVLSALIGIAVIAFGAPIAAFAVVAWGGAAAHAATKPWADRRVGRQ